MEGDQPTRRSKRPAPPVDRRVTIGRIVHYWTEEAGRLVENAALVVSVGDDGERVWLHVFYRGGFGGNDRCWAQYSPVPMEGRWTWPLIV